MADQQNCPVCGMEVSQGSSYTATYDDQTCQFCSQGCQDAFVKDPGSYVGNTGS